ncbi:MAG: hypothetical protein WAW85_05360 [Gordonia sp. (in: high G+C Gram-positive bacteria)]|uniref:hypothetical protein n=1 Tax=Gordonia sp. (in: high G+C Gram-positive bacteria) TaxID=84139 RepID=UPI003BB79088
MTDHTAATYSEAICPAERMVGWYDVAVRATLIPASGEPARQTVGCYLDAHENDGPVSLGCGVEMLFHDLQSPLPPGESLTALVEAVTGGLNGKTWTALQVPGRADLLVIALIDWQTVPGSLLSDEIDDDRL